MSRQYFTGFWLGACCLALPVSAAAQQPAVSPTSQRQRDSLAAEIRALRARLDSLIAALAARPAVAEPGPARDELATLRAAAAAAAGPDTAAARDSAPPPAAGRERNLSALNPEISVSTDIRGYARTTGVQQDNFDPREVEVGFQSALDPYSHTKIFVAFEGGEVDIEEAYAYWTGLPGHIRVDVGKVRQQLGELNRWHLHALPESEYPLALATYVGDEGLTGTGLSVYWAAPTSGAAGVHELWGQVTQGSNAGLFDAGNRLAVLGHLNNFWQVNASTYFQVGATGIYGTNPDTALSTTLGGLDVRLTWRPPQRAQYREWTVRGEVFGLQKERAGAGQTRYGGYVGTTYKLGRRWIAGLRYDYVEAPEGPKAIVRQIVPSLTLWQSEWVYLRGQYIHRRDPAGTTGQLALQAVWAIGPHKHETY
jgi:hypothetical protein